MAQILRNRLFWNPSTSPFAILGTGLALVLFSSGAWAAAPNVVVDSQLTPIGGLNGPQSIAMAPNNTYYVADAGNNRVEAYVNGTASTVSTGTYTLVSPQAVAADSLGDLFIGDSPSSGVGRVIEAQATNGVLNGTVSLVVVGGDLKDVTALTVDTTPTSSTFNTLYIGDDVSAAIYSVTAGSTVLVPLNIAGLPSNVLPSAMVKDTSGNLFVADFNSTLYRIPAGSSSASIYFVPDFTIYSPTGLALDPRGDLYILTLTNTAATPSQPVPLNVVEIPGGDTSSAFRVPFTGIQNGSGIAFDSLGNLYIVDLVGSAVTEVVYGSPVGLSEVSVNTVGPSITFNYELNAATKLRGFKFVSSGDTSTEIQDEGGACATGTYNDGSDGGAISPSDPLICQESFAAEPAYPGLRYGAVELKGTSSSILASTEVYSTGFGGASVLYPMHAATGATGINGPIALAVSGLDKKLYIVNNGNTPEILSANGPGGKTLTQVSTAPVTLSVPLGIAINGEGDLYIADYGLSAIVVVPANAAVTPYTLNPGTLLEHPVALAFDTNGNLFIGDSGSAGLNADASDPGFMVEVPVGGGAPFKVNTGAITIIFPQAIAADPYTGAIIVGDGGPIEGPGQVVDIPSGGGTASVVTPSGVTNPVGIAFDPAEEYYVLDQNSNEITVVRPPALGPYTYTIDTTSALIDFPSALAITNGGQSFVVSNYASTGVDASNNLIYLNGTATSTLSFGTVVVGQQSGTLHARLNSIGSGAFAMQTPYVTTTGDTSAFSVLNETTCFSGLQLTPASPCDLYYQFVPITTGKATSTNTFNTTGYVPNVSVLELEGTGRR